MPSVDGTKKLSNYLKILPIQRISPRTIIFWKLILVDRFYSAEFEEAAVRHEVRILNLQKDENNGT